MEKRSSKRESKIVKEIIHLEQLQSWISQKSNDGQEILNLNVGDARSSSSSSQICSKTSFKLDDTINHKIYLWRGDICSLSIDAIVSPSNNWTKGSIAARIAKSAGPLMRVDFKHDDCVKSGCVKMTSGHLLPSKFIIHTNSPRYQDRFRHAAENALNSCYRTALTLLKAKNLHSIAFTHLGIQEKGFPLDQATHVALRTIRKCMEIHGEGVDNVVFCCETEEEFNMYNQLLPLYFPRTIDEESNAKHLLPENTGNEFGEIIIEERKIRISAFPGTKIEDSSDEESDNNNNHHSSSSDNESDDDNDDDVIVTNETIAKAVASGITEMTTSPDIIKTSTTQTTNGKGQQKTQHQIEIEKAYYHYLHQSRSTNLDSIRKSRIIYHAGKDKEGRNLIVVIAKNLVQNNVDLRKALLYIIWFMDSIGDSPFSIIYLHSEMEKRKLPEMSWLREVQDLFDFKYATMLHACYVVHATTWLKLFLAVFSPFLSRKLRDKMIMMPKLTQLFTFFGREQLRLPPEIYTFDYLLHGYRWENVSGSGSSSSSPKSTSSSSPENHTRSSTMTDSPQFISLRLVQDEL